MHGYVDRSKNGIFLYIQVSITVETTQSNSPQSGTIWSSSGDLPNTESDTRWAQQWVSYMYICTQRWITKRNAYICTLYLQCNTFKIFCRLHVQHGLYLMRGHTCRTKQLDIPLFWCTFRCVHFDTHMYVWNWQWYKPQTFFYLLLRRRQILAHILPHHKIYMYHALYIPRPYHRYLTSQESCNGKQRLRPAYSPRERIRIYCSEVLRIEMKPINRI